VSNYIDNLVSRLEKASEAYYLNGNSEYTDDQYDALVNMLRRVSPDHPYLKKVGTEKSTGTKVGHMFPMGTLSKYHKEEEVLEWIDERLRGQSFIVAPKYDGFGVELYYKDGDLLLASTRGDGDVGEDVTNAMYRILSIPQRIKRKDTVIVRGEVLAFSEVHDILKENGYTAMRNAVPGIVRSCREDMLQYLTFVAHEFIPISGVMDDSDSPDDNKDRDLLRRYFKDSFKVEDYEIIEHSATDLRDYYNEMSELRKSSVCPFEFDGIVIKSIMMKDKPEDLYNPLYSIAWKFKSKYEATILRDVEFQLGVTGKFNPIAIFDPVEFQGATLTRASLGSIDRMYKLIDEQGLRLESVIEVTRHGDIIPYVERVALTDDSLEPINVPDVCPYCGSKLYHGTKDARDLVCTNDKCDEKVRMRLYNYVSGVKVRGLGGALVEALKENYDLVYRYMTIKDLYELDPYDSGLGTSMANKYKQFQDKKLTSLQLMTIYPFDNLSSAAWKTLLERVDLETLLLQADIHTPGEFMSFIINLDLRGLRGDKGKNLAMQVYKNRDELKYLYKRVVSH